MTVDAISRERNDEASDEDAAALAAFQFLARLWCADAQGALSNVHMIAEKTSAGWIHHPVYTVHDAVARAREASARGRNAYFACGAYSNFNGSSKGNRTQINALGAGCFWLDLDCGEDKSYPDKTAALQALHHFCKSARLPKPSLFVDSGNGLHVYWQFGQLIEKEVWEAAAENLKRLANAAGLKADPSRTADIASVLRVPGTHNWKDPKSPKPVVILSASAERDPNAFTSALETAAQARFGSIARNAVPPVGHADGLGDNTTRAASPPPPVETMRAMLKHLMARDHFKDRKTWVEAGMALKVAYGNEGGADLWAEAHEDEQARADAPVQWASFAATAQPGHVTVGTIIKAATSAGFVYALSAQSPTTPSSAIVALRLTGNGGDVKNGRIFASMFRDKLLHVHETGDWLQFDPQQGWVFAPPGEADRAAKEVLEAMRAIAADQYKAAPEDPKTKRLMAHVERSSKAQSLRAMIEMAKSELGMTVQLSDFDRDPMLLGVANGVLNLSDWKVLPATPTVLVSKRCNVAYDPNAKCARFRQFLVEVQPEKEMRGFLRRLMGYCLTGAVDEQMFAFIYGLGANGKSVFIELMAWMLGDYAHKISTEMLMHHQRNPQGPSPDIVSLRGRRFVYANETEEGGRLAEARIKDLTGGDTLTGRVPYGKADITFRPTHKLFIVGNHKPEITDNSFGMWRRVALTPFEQTIPEASRDPRLLAALKEEASGILNWMIAGLRDYRKAGLQVPQKIKAATAAYREEQDVIGEWIVERCISGAGCSEKKGVLYGGYQDWAKLNGHRPLAQGRLTRRLNERGFRLSQDRRTIIGLSLPAGGGLGGGPTP